MHAFLINSKDPLEAQKKADEISKKQKVKLVGFALKKIEDVRNLNKLTRLTVTEPTAYFIENVEDAGEEALNAFLKNLEEPQENLFYILTTSNISNVLPTIVSRCQVITATGHQQPAVSKEIEKFNEMKTGEKLAYVDKIKDRGVAIEFIEEYIETLHIQLHSTMLIYINIVNTKKNLEIALSTLKRLKANGNVTLQLANFVINLL